MLFVKSSLPSFSKGSNFKNKQSAFLFYYLIPVLHDDILGVLSAVPEVPQTKGFRVLCSMLLLLLLLLLAAHHVLHQQLGVHKSFRAGEVAAAQRLKICRRISAKGTKKIYYKRKGDENAKEEVRGEKEEGG
jgi:hypothetical protein